MTLPSVSRHHHSPSDKITVIVYKSSFSLVASLYQKVEKLPWQQRRGVPYLNVDADVFELLLQYLMFGKLPATTHMTNRQAAELLRMIKPLDNMDALIEHVKFFREACQRNRKFSTSLRRQLSSFNFKTMQTHHDDSQAPPSSTCKTNTTICAVGSKDMDLFSVTDTEISPTGSIVTMDSLPNLQVANSMDSSEAMSTCCERKVPTENPIIFARSNSSILPSNPFDIYVSTPASNPFDFYIPTSDGLNACSVDLNPSLSSSSSVSSSYQASKSFRTAFFKLQGKGSSRTHAEWCASEFVI